MNDELTVVHMGDADPNPSHFLPQESYWAIRKSNTAFPPYWFFLSPGGNDILDQYVRPAISIGVHIPADPDNQPEKLTQFDVFKIPGENRQLIAPTQSQ